MTLSRKLAHLLGGNVVLKESQVGQGSIFTVSIALEQEAMVQKAPVAKNKPRIIPVEGSSMKELKGQSVLLVEDAADNQVLFSHILTKAGALVDIASNGKEGLEKALEREYDLILMDMQMPVLDGYTATQDLRARGYNKTIIALTAHALKEDLKKCIDVGCDDVITKPINIKKFLSQINYY